MDEMQFYYLLEFGNIEIYKQARSAAGCSLNPSRLDN